MSHLLDTNVCIAAINGAPVHVRVRLEEEGGRGHTFFVSTLTAFELFFGAYKSARVDANLKKFALFLDTLAKLTFDEGDAEIAGAIRAELERKGRPIGAYDYLIAAQAVRRGLVLVTANMKEFERVPNLRVENWVR